MGEKPHHATINLERSYPAPVGRVFAAFADPVTRAKWSAPPNDALIYDEANFCEGGRDVFRCGPANDLKFRGETTYLVIVPNQCVISAETVVTAGKRLAVALNSLGFDESGAGTTLKLTVQLVSFAGPGVVEAYQSGNRSALEGLSTYLQSPP
ncbi:MAG: SRPBCC domain-containing protein [Terriglobales bacterium]